MPFWKATAWKEKWALDLTAPFSLPEFISTLKTLEGAATATVSSYGFPFTCSPKVSDHLISWKCVLMYNFNKDFSWVVIDPCLDIFQQLLLFHMDRGRWVCLAAHPAKALDQCNNVVYGLFNPYHANHRRDEGSGTVHAWSYTTRSCDLLKLTDSDSVMSVKFSRWTADWLVLYEGVVPTSPFSLSQMKLTPPVPVNSEMPVLILVIYFVRKWGLGWASDEEGKPTALCGLAEMTHWGMRFKTGSIAQGYEDTLVPARPWLEAIGCKGTQMSQWRVDCVIQWPVELQLILLRLGPKGSHRENGLLTSGFCFPSASPSP